jgi:hypothetical protein
MIECSWGSLRGRFKFNNHVFVICELLTTAMTG